MGSSPGIYDASFYDRLAEGALASAREVLPLLFSRIPTGSFVDVGCGIGNWLSVAKECGVGRVLGIDGPWVSGTQRVLGQGEFLELDFEAAPIVLPSRFDMASCLEVAEHLPASAAPRLVRSLTALSDLVLFSAAIPGQGGLHHVNEQWPDYWVQLFDAAGYAVIDFLRPQLWRNERVDVWYRQNLLLFVARSRLAESLPLRRLEEEYRGWPLNVVHPLLFTYKQPPKEEGVGSLLRKLLPGIGATIRYRVRRVATALGQRVAAARVVVHDWKARLGMLRIPPSVPGTGTTVHPVCFVCREHFEHLRLALLSLARLRSPLVRKAYVFECARSPLTPEQAQRLREIPGLPVVVHRLRLPMTAGGTNVVLNELHAFRKLAKEMADGDYLLKFDSDVVFFDARFVDEAARSGAEIVGTSIKPELPIGEAGFQGGGYFLRRDVLPKFLKTTVRPSIDGIITGSFWTRETVPEDLVMSSLAARLGVRPMANGFMPNAVGWIGRLDLTVDEVLKRVRSPEEPRSMLHFERSRYNMERLGPPLLERLSRETSGT